MEEKDAQFLYRDGSGFHFMDSETYDQYSITEETLEGKEDFLKEGEMFKVIFWENEPLDVKLPYKMAFTVTYAEDAVKGDTVSGTTKVVTVETGLKVRVPIFIKQNDRILVNTETGDYVERVN